MDDFTRMRLMAQLTRDEGRRNLMYFDSVGVPTIGVGHNLRDRALTDRAVDLILEDDLRETELELVTALPWVADLGSPRFGVLINMAFNMGVQGVLEFRDMLAAIQAGDWEKAADAMRDSKWAEQVGARATRLERQMLAGEWVVR
jgi:lysozyme